MKKYFLNTVILMLFGVAVMMSACKKGPDFTTYTYAKETVNGISPASGFATSNVVITGKDFGAFKGAVKVYFNGIPATNIVSVVNDQIVVQVPTNAVSGKVSLSVWTNRVDSVGIFTVLPAPTITSDSSRSTIAPVIAAGGDTVDIKGTNFLTDPTMVSVDFNGVPAAKIATLNSTFIQVIAPSSYVAGNLNVTFNGFKIACPTALAPSIQPGDVSAYFLKNYKQPFYISDGTYSNQLTTAQQNGRWYTPGDWTVTANMKNHTNGFLGTAQGGLDYRPTTVDQGLVLGVEAGWGAPVIVDGMCYQTVTLLPGTYTFSAFELDNNIGNNVYLVAVAGAGPLPVSANINSSTTLGFTSWGNHGFNDYGGGGTPPASNLRTFNFTVVSKSQVTLGYVIQNFGTSGYFVRFRYFKLALN